MIGPRWSVAIGAVGGVLPYAALLLIDLARAPVTEAEFFDWPGTILFFGGLLVTPLVLVTGLVLAIIRRTRRIGVSLLISATVTAAAALYVASEVLPSIPALRH